MFREGAVSARAGCLNLWRLGERFCRLLTTKPRDMAEVWEAIRKRPTVGVEITCRALSVSTWAGYQAIRRGDFPVPTLSVGRRIVVPTAPLRRALGVEREPA